MQVFLEFTTVVILAAIVSIIMRLLKQPLVVGYILTGILISPQALNIIHTKDYLELFSHIGITILLFIVGLQLSPKVIKEVGKVSLLGGLGQILLTFVVGFGISNLLGITALPSFYLASALTFSSTIIVLKLLSDKGDLEKLHGKIAIGFLIVQDLVAVAVLMGVSSVGGASGSLSITALFILFAKALEIFIVLYLICVYVFPRMIAFIATSQELLFLFSVSWGLGLACLFYILGFSIEVGALVAGVVLSLTPYSYGIASRLKPLRDFFIVLFFVSLGSQIALANIPQILFQALILSLFVIVGKPLIVFILMNLLGFKMRTGFQVGVSLAQVSEFSLILATLGLAAGHIDKQIVSLITLTAMLTITASSYLVLSADAIYPYCKRLLEFLEFNKKTNNLSHENNNHDLILFGFDNVGQDFVEAFVKLEKQYLVIDMNPKLIKQMELTQVPHKFGDAGDVELLEELNLKAIKLCVSTIPEFKVNALLIKTIRQQNEKAIIIVRTHEKKEAKELYELGATYVVMPHYLGAKYAANMIERLGLDKKGFEEEREKHLVHINK